jgi:peptide/nickel transport system substrate-binding protein
VRKLAAVVAVIGLSAISLCLSSCGSSGSEGKEGGTLKGTYASFPDYLDPALSDTQEGLTAMYDTYVPLLTYAHAAGAAGGKVVPGLAESMPKITNGGKTYTLTLRKGLEYSDGTPVKASDFARAIERTLGLNSSGSSLYMGIVGTEKFAKTKAGGISGIKTDNQTGKITIELTAPNGSFANALGLLFAAPVPGDTPMKNLTAEPPPATGPYVIVKSEPGRSWSYARNPQWAKNNAKLVPNVPSGHVDKIDLKVVRNPSTQVNEVERGKSDWMQTTLPANVYSQVKSKYEGTQFRVEPTISNYFFWMNTTRPPFDDLKVRQAVNYALNGEALERIYAGSLKAIQQILPPGMPGYKQFELYPHNLAKAKKLIAEADPSDRNITVWTDDESPNNEAGAYYEGVLNELGFNAKLKEVNAEDYFTLITNQSTPELDTGWADWFEEYPNPNNFFQPLLSGASILPVGNTNFALIDDPKLNAKIKRLSEEPLGPQQEAEYAELDREYMEQAPWAPYGTRTISTFVSSAIDLENVVFNPTFGQDLASFQFK